MIDYLTSGSGDRWLVFVHGFTCDRSDWSNQIAAFEAEHRVLAIDLRGHGQSAALSGPQDIETHASDIIQILCYLNITDAILIGHSMGTRVIASACVQAPDRVAGLMFIDGSVQGRGDPCLAGAAIAKSLQDDASVPEFAEALFSMMFTDASDQSLKQSVVRRAVQMPPATFREQLRLMMMWDAGRFETVLSQVGVPLSVLQSTSVDKDKIRRSLTVGETTEYLDLVKQLASHATIEVVPDCGHFTQFEAVAETNAAIAALVRSVVG